MNARATPAPVLGPGWPAERVSCGATHPHPDVERRAVALRAAVGAPPDTAGCGHAGVWYVMHRCAECSRWFHRTCLLEHFAAHAESPAALATNRLVLRDAVQSARVTLEHAAAQLRLQSDYVSTRAPLCGGALVTALCSLEETVTVTAVHLANVLSRTAASGEVPRG